jgi:GT2 family glycosyltransferase
MTRVLIGIPTLNGPSRLDRVLKSIRECTDLTGVTVLVSDDCSTKENLKLNKDTLYSVPGTEMLMSERRLGVPAQWNRLVRHVPDADVCVLLNDDVEVTDDWLDVLVFSLERNPHAGMVGLRSDTGVVKSEALKRPRIDYYESRLMCGGGSLLSSGGACFAFRRTDWAAVGEFDERYFYFYEEIDFGISLTKKLGRFNYIADYPVIYHMGGATMASLAPEQVLLESRQRFTDKWRTTLDTLRLEFGKRLIPNPVEWNTSLKVSRHP